MSGHSKWATIRRKKAVVDSKRAQLFTKVLREVQVAARIGGGNPEGNSRLKTAIASARAVSTPTDNINRAIAKGSGDLEGQVYEEITYEGYGPGGVAVLVKTMTDNKNRTVSDVRHAFSKNNGSLASANSVAFQFEEKGVLNFPKEDASEDKLMELALDAGATDVQSIYDEWEVTCEPRDLENLRKTLQPLSEKLEGAIKFIPANTVKVAGAEATSVLRLVDMLDDLDDVQNVYANFEIDDETLLK